MKRQFLITKFVCASCGEVLELTYDKPPTNSGGRYFEGEPTGVAMVQQTVSVLPCACATRPLEEMRKAADTLFGSWSKMTEGRVK
jgi:hypothetical protein